MNAEPSRATTGAWIFVSHSHRDLEKVRTIRNELEARGHNPLLFFLKCMEDDDARLPELIREEIRAREWFILCDSPHARDSGWVQQETELIKAMEGKVFETIDLSKDLEAELHKLIRISKRATVFISYAAPDYQIKKRIRQALSEHDYCVWTYPDDLPPASVWETAIRDALAEAAEHGIVLHLLSPAALTSRHFEREVIYALQQSDRENVLPVIVAAFESEGLPDTLRYAFEPKQYFDLTTGPFEERIEELIHNLKTLEME